MSSLVRRAEQALAADGAIACFSSDLIPRCLNDDRAPQLKRSVRQLQFRLKTNWIFRQKSPRKFKRSLSERENCTQSACLKIARLVMIHSSIGYGCYFSPDGDIYIEKYDIASDELRLLIAVV